MRKIILVTLKSTLLMKKIFTLLILMCSLGVMAQEYTPLVREGVKWECVLDVWKPQNEVGPNYFHYPYTISFDGDTIINGKNYKKCFYQFADNDVATSDIPRAFVREDLADRKVYCIDNIDFQYYVAAPEIWAPDREYLLYDFANPTNKEQFWCIYDSSDTISSAVEIGGKQLNKHVVFGISLIESIGYAGNGNDYENYCFHGDLLSPMIGYRTCLCETSYPTFRRFVDENRQAVYSLSRVEIDESYIPLVREGVKWNCVLHKTYSEPTSPEEQDVHSFYSIKFDGDTIINGITYKKCYYVFDDANEPSNIIPRAFVREDVLNKKVYVIYNTDYACGKGVVEPANNSGIECLLYDFDDMSNNEQIWRDNFSINYYTDISTKVNDSIWWSGYAFDSGNSPDFIAGVGLVGATATWSDLLTLSLYAQEGGVNVSPQFLNLEDAEGNIIYTASEFNMIENIATDNNGVEVCRYDLYGRRLSQPTQGVNIVKMSDGTTRKEMVK